MVVNDDAFIGKRGVGESSRQASSYRERGKDLDDEIVSIFLEEAVDILDSAGQALQRWLGEPQNVAPLSSLQRDMHTSRAVRAWPRSSRSVTWPMSWKPLRRPGRSSLQLQRVGLTDLLQRSHERLAQLLEQLQQHQPWATARS
jgi:chemosensory pili system protein ChpA (sensor histidine kinase/response regulator)